jgi:hypothetical protein
MAERLEVQLHPPINCQKFPDPRTEECESSQATTLVLFGSTWPYREQTWQRPCTGWWCELFSNQLTGFLCCKIFDCICVTQSHDPFARMDLSYCTWIHHFWCALCGAVVTLSNMPAVAGRATLFSPGLICFPAAQTLGCLKLHLSLSISRALKHS